MARSSGGIWEVHMSSAGKDLPSCWNYRAERSHCRGAPRPMDVVSGMGWPGPVDELPLWSLSQEPSPRTRWCLSGCTWGPCLTEQTLWMRSRPTSGIHTHRWAHPRLHGSCLRKCLAPSSQPEPVVSTNLKIGKCLCIKTRSSNL